ncbi:AI-2E family transporter [archaeon]|jgi:predicted PurR-regulated permease PerM|nr:AI-2E family transporter [archaeon]MBT4242149.1 AI-2E family transporter [archaeon]MBT4417837.1 AI-2E family transporter [archaeon]
MVSKEEQAKKTRKYIAAGIIVILSLFLAYALYPFIPAFFGALIFFVLLRPIFKFLNRKLKLSKTSSALIVISIALIILIIGVVFIINSAVNETKTLIENREVFIKSIEKIDARFPQLDFKKSIVESLPQVVEYTTNLLLGFFKGTGPFLINLIILCFALYYLFIEEEIIIKRFFQLTPFSPKNSKELVEEFRNVTYSTIITTGIIAILQGFLLGLAFFIFGIPGAVLWGLITAIISFLPIIGPPIIWVPVVAWQFIEKDYTTGIGILIFGVILSTADNFLRPYIQRRVGRMHPMTSLIGFFMGISFFGLIGIVIGPLLLSYFVLILRMFKEEYLEI